MSNQQPTPFVSRTGRLVFGDLYVPKTTDYDGNPLLIKNGPDAGKPTQRYEFGVAFEKVPGQTHFSQDVLGAMAWAVGHAAHPASATRDDFSWKVVDGDSNKPGKIRNGKPSRAPNAKEGYPGHWVMTFSSSYAPKIVNTDGSAYILDKDAVVPGDYVQVSGTIAGNQGANAGIYLNHNFVSLQAKGKPITNGPDPATLGFGRGAKPNVVAPAPFVPPAAAPALPVAAPPPAAPMAAPAPTAVAPAPSFIAPPAVPPAPPVGPQMTAKAVGASYDSFRVAGWSDEAMRANGYLA